MSSQHSLSIVIGASFKGGFGATLKGSITQLTTLGQTIKKLEATGKSIGAFEQLKHTTLKTKQAWMQAEAQVKSLSQAIAKTATPSKALLSSFEKSKNAAHKAKHAYLKQRDALHVLKQKLDLTGQDMERLTAKQQKLGASINSLKEHYKALDTLLQKRQGIIAYRAQLRGQLLDMVALGAALSAPLRAAMHFESAMADIKKVVQFDSPKGLEALEYALKKMSRTIPLSAEGLAQIAASGGQLGIASHHLSSFTGIVAKMATAFDMMLSEAGDAMAKLSNVYRIPITEMTNLGDAINTLSDNSAAKAKDIVSSLKRIGGTARQFGLSAEQASALSASFVALGKSPEKAGTAINALLTKLQTATKQGRKFQEGLEAIGLSSEGLEQAINQNAQAGLLQFLETIEKVENSQRAGLLFDLFGMEYQDDVALLVGSLEEYKKALGLVAQESSYAGSMEREFINRTKTTSNHLQLLKNNVTELGITIGTLLLPPINKLMGFLSLSTTKILHFTETHPKLTKVILGVTSALIGGKIALIALGYAWSFFQGGALAFMAISRGLVVSFTLLRAGLLGINAAAFVTALRLGALAFGGAVATIGSSFLVLARSVFPLVIAGFRALSLAIMTNPIGAALLGLSLATSLMMTNWKDLQHCFMTLWEPIKPIWESFKLWVGEFWKTISKPFKAVGNMWDKMRGKPYQAQSNKESDYNENTSSQTHEAHFFQASLPTPTAQNHTYHNNFSISVQAQPHQDTRKIAEEVIRRLKSHTRGALYDPIGVGS